MKNSLLGRYYEMAKNVLLYQPPQVPRPFVLGENKSDSPTSPQQNLQQSTEELRDLLEQAGNLAQTMDKLRMSFTEGQGFQVSQEVKDQLAQLEKKHTQEKRPTIGLNCDQIKADQVEISSSLTENELAIRDLYRLPENKDVVMRRFEIPAKGQPLEGMLVYIDGMIDKKVINLTILQPLMAAGEVRAETSGEVLRMIKEKFLPSNQARHITKLSELADGVNAGDTVFMVDGEAGAILMETKGYEHRSLGKPNIEQSVRGSQTAFSDTLRVNTGLIRTLMPTNDLVTEMMPVGDRVPLNCAIMYLKSVANPDLVSEVKRRIGGISTDYILNSEILEQFIEDHPSSPLPQSLSTERPDRVAVHLVEGRVAILVDGSPFVHVVPVSIFSFFHSVEDFSLKIPAGNFMRVLRIVSTLISLILPAMYLGISYYHQEAIPTELALAIAGARERVPFPAIIEILLMEFSFELIREAGLRVPGVLGQTIGIVGAIILGQAAVSANLVSPIMVVIIAITGLASFSIPDYRLSFAFRIIRFGFLLLASALGLIGIAAGLLVLLISMVSMKSFGMPYFAPVAPKVAGGRDVILRGSIFMQEKRPDQLNALDTNRQPNIAKRWMYKKPAGREDKS